MKCKKITKDGMFEFLFFLVMAVLVIVFCFFMFPTTNPENAVIIAQGKVANVDYLQGSFLGIPKTIITFENGSNYILRGIYSMPSNTIEIIKNGDSYSVQNKLKELK